ncbi:hypothetical protein [Anderseniella sp. Alg231-50]|uniref:hypothetical protein n=1 Tax=Anderseniella sp. Alg231-50 TaxID=1922226 RepID=UPI000D558E18
MSGKPSPGPKPLADSWPRDLTVAEVLAIKSLGAGVANEGQQKTALEVIMKRFCGYYELTFHEHSERLSAFGEGRRYVGAMIQEALITPAAPNQEKI